MGLDSTDGSSLNLAHSLYSGSRAIFPTDPGTTIETSDDLQLRNRHDVPEIPQVVLDLADKELLVAFRDLQQLCAILNAETASGKRFPAAAFQIRISSTQSRLLRLQSLESSFAERLRLSLLAFLASTFQISAADAPYPYLAGHYRESCISLEISKPTSHSLTAWFLMIGAISVFSPDEDWLLDHWRAEVPSTATWVETREGLKSILWIDAIHDQAGQELFEALACQDVGVTDRSHSRRYSSRAKLWASGWAGNTYEVS